MEDDARGQEEIRCGSAHVIPVSDLEVPSLSRLCRRACGVDALDLPAHLKNRQALRDNPYSVQASEVAGG